MPTVCSAWRAHFEADGEGRVFHKEKKGRIAPVSEIVAWIRSRHRPDEKSPCETLPCHLMTKLCQAWQHPKSKLI